MAGEAYDGENKKFELMMWMRKKAQKSVQSQKKVIELSKDHINSGLCTRKDKKYCLIGFYDNNQNKNYMRSALNDIIKNFISDPINAFIVDKNKLDPVCLFGPDQGKDMFYFLRSKRGKFANFESDPSVLKKKIEAKLTGSMMQDKMQNDVSACFKP